MIFARRMWQQVARSLYRTFLWPYVAEQIRHAAIEQMRVFGDPRRATISPSARVFNVYINVASGNVIIGDYAFFGNNVSLVTGAHDYAQFGSARQEAVPNLGRDIVIGAGVWIGANATILGPCVVGEHAVVAAGAVVTHDVAPFSVVAGVPAREIRKIGPPTNPLATGSVPLNFPK